MQPVMGVAPVVPQMNGSLGQVPVTAPPAYGFFQGYPQAQVYKSILKLAELCLISCGVRVIILSEIVWTWLW